MKNPLCRELRGFFHSKELMKESGKPFNRLYCILPPLFGISAILGGTTYGRLLSLIQD